MKPFTERNPLVVGVIGIALTAVLAGAALQYDKLPLFSPGANYTAYFAEAGGLTSGAAVQVSGMRVGQVSDISLDGPRVLVKFSADKNVVLGDRTEAAIKTKSLLGAKILEVTPRGSARLSEPIPLARTTSPYQLPDALGDLTATISGLDTGQLSDSLKVLAQTFQDTAPDLSVAVAGVGRISETINTRDALLRNLLANANKATTVLAERADQVVGLITNTNAVLAQLQTQSSAVDQIANNVSAASKQLSGFVADNRTQIGHALDTLNGVLAILDKRKERLQKSIKLFNNYTMSLGESVSSGPFLSAYIANLAPGQFVQPFVDSAFSDLGLDPNVLLPSQRTDPQTGQPATPALPVPYPRTGQGGEPNLTLPDAITGQPGDPRYPYRPPLPVPAPGGPPPGPPAVSPDQSGPAPSPPPAPIALPTPAPQAAPRMRPRRRIGRRRPRRGKGSKTSKILARLGTTILAIILILELVAATMALLGATRPGGRTNVVAYFDNSNGIFTGDQVRILGVPVGKIAKIEPQPERTKITFWFDDKYQVPADANAVIISPSLVTSRAIQLTPAYTGGPTMHNDALIPQNHTAVPIEWDDFRKQLQTLTQYLQPTEPGGVSTIGALVNTAADNLRGQGANIRDTLTKLSQAFSALGDHSTDIFSTVKNLSILVSALQSSADVWKELNQNLASVTAMLANDPNEIASAVDDLNTAVGDVRGFVADNRGAVGTTSDKLASVSQALTDSLDDIKQTLHIGPNGIQNFMNAYHPAIGSLAGILDLNNFANPITFLCGAIQAASRLNYEQSAKLCVQYLAPIVKNRQYNFPPLGENLFVGAQARPNEITYSEDWMRPDYIPPQPPTPAGDPLAPDASAPGAAPADPVATDPAAGLPGIMLPPGGRP